MCYIDEQKNKYSVLNERNRMLKYNICKVNTLPLNLRTLNHLVMMYLNRPILDS
jgi:hypothetical protein